VDRLRTVASVIVDDEHYTNSDPSASPSDSPSASPAADFKPAAPHPLEGSAGGPADEPASGA
jgi:hypothetical protein